MAAQLSKADQIRKLLPLHLSNAEIERRTGLPQSYIRSVRQRTSSDGYPIRTAAEMEWLSRNPDYMREYMRMRLAEARAS